HSTDCARPASERLKVSGEVFVAQADIPVAIKAAANPVTSVLDFMLVPPWWECVGTRSVSAWPSAAHRLPRAGRDRCARPTRGASRRARQCDVKEGGASGMAWLAPPRREIPALSRPARRFTHPGARPGPMAQPAVPGATAAGASGRTADAAAGSAG